MNKPEDNFKRNIKKHKKNNRPVWHPGYWIYWLVLFVLWCVIQLPYPVFMRIGKYLGYVVSLFSSYVRKVTEINLKLCFPELSDQERKKLLRKNFASLGMAMMETAFSWFAPDRRLKGLLDLYGEEHVAAIKQGGQGVLMIVPHFHSLEIAGRLYSQKTTELSTVYRPHRKAVIEKFNYKHLSRNFKRVIPKTNLRDMLRALRDKQALFFLPDIDAGKKQSIFANFFGIQTASVAGVSKLAELGKAKVVCVKTTRKSDLSGYEVYLSKPIENYPSDNLLHDVERVNQYMESAIREYPEEYLWQYRRFETRPDGEANFYPKRKSKSKRRG